MPANGDEYNYSPPVNDLVCSSENTRARIELIEAGPLRAKLKTEVSLEVPEQLSLDGKSRSEKTKTLTIVSEVGLTARSRRVDFVTRFDNNVKDHRLRVVFPAGISTEESIAEQQFGYIKRPNYRRGMDSWRENGWTEAPLPIYPEQSFVCVEDKSRGIALLNRNLPEYEVLDDEDGSSIALTLVRSVGYIGRPDLVIRPGRASGLEVETPDAQCPGKHLCEYAFLPYTEGFSKAGVPDEAARYNRPVLTGVIEKAKGASSALQTLVAVKTPGLVTSTVKKAEAEHALIHRLYNCTTEPIKNGVIEFGFTVRQALLSRLAEDENGAELIQTPEGEWILPEVKPNQVITVKVIPEGSLPAEY